jgi:hypothetical protein
MVSEERPAHPSRDETRSARCRARVRFWRSYAGLTEEEARAEAARCLSCGYLLRMSAVCVRLPGRGHRPQPG